MQKSKFQFSNPRIEKIDFRVNDKNIDLDNLPINISVQNKIDGEARESITKLNLVAGQLNEDDTLMNAFYFNGIISAEFKWDEQTENPGKMLEINGGAVLLSYIRPVLANLTMQAGMKPLNLPFIDFTK